MEIKSIMHSGVYTLPADTTIREAAIKMYEWKIGAVIIGEPYKIEGIFSERDLLNKVVGVGKSVEETTLAQVMTKNVLTVHEESKIENALKMMEEKNIRHLPVVNSDNKCVGMLGIRDLMKAHIKSIETEGIMQHIMDLMTDD